MASAEDQARATARGEQVRADLLAKLEDGPQSAADLHPHTAADVSLSEVAFQLTRLTDERKTLGTPGGVYRLAT
jgi:predicted transcriptional regulator